MTKNHCCGDLFAAYKRLLFLFLTMIALPIASFSQKVAVAKGVVVNASKNPIEGASVIVKSTNVGTVSNDLGEFQLNSVDSTAIIIVSGTGYKPIELKVSEILSKPIVLFLDDKSLEGVIITGYQKIERKRFSGAATSISAKDVNIDGQVDVSRMLQGKVAGVSVQNVSGTFGAAPKIRIRGATSLSGDNKPLWVVDGIVLEDIVPISNDQLSSGDPTTLLGSSVAGLNANDIETFDILKDASATALYGGRAMNGVVVITTKKGRKGNPAVAYTGNFTTAFKPNYNNYNIMNSSDQMTVLNEMLNKGNLNLADIGNRSDWGVYGKMYRLLNTYNPQKDGGGGEFILENTPEAKNAFLRRYATSNTDWFDILFKDQFLQEHNIQLSSGTDRSQNLVSLSLYKDNGWTIADKVSRMTLNFKNNFALNDRITTEISTRASYRNQRAPGANSRKSNPVNGQYDREFDINPFSYALNSNRALTAYDENGNLEFFQRNFAPFNIIHELENNYMKLNVLDIQLQGDLRYKIHKNINYSFSGAIRMVNTNNETIITEYSNAAEAYRMLQTSIIASANRYTYSNPDDLFSLPVSVLPKGGFYNKAETMLKTYNFRNVLSYNKVFGNIHSVNVLAGQEIRSYDRENFKSTGPGIQYDQGGEPFISYLYYKKTIEQNHYPYNISPEFERAASYFATAAYTFNNRYNIEGTVRYDGGNKLGRSKNARWLPTGSVSASWNVDQEKFMQNVEQVSYLKLRASYGMVGSLGNATNAAAVYRSGTTMRPYTDEKETYLTIESLENSMLTWEKKRSFDIGMDAGFFKRRLSMVFDYYYNASYDLIDEVRTSGIGGQYVKYANNADMIGHGIELSLNGVIINEPNINWTVGGNFGTNINKITKTATTPRIWDLIQASGGNFRGYPVFSLFSIDFKKLSEFEGTPYFTNENSDVSNNVYFQATKLYNKSGEVVSIDKVLKYEGSVTPKITGGFNNAIRWKNLSLNFFVSFQAGNKIRLDPVLSNQYVDLDAFPREFANRFVMPSDEVVTGFPAIMDKLSNYRVGGTNLYNSYNYSTERVAKGDFVRLQTVNLQYQALQTLVSRWGVKSLSFGVTANNLWLIYSDKKLYGSDPEFFNSGGVAMPVSKQVTFSVKVGF